MRLNTPKKCIVDGGILAGGLSRRFGGQDKALLPWRGQALIQPIIHTLQPYVDTLYVSANQNHDDYRAITSHIVPDLNPDCLGPLSGISSLLDTSTADYLLISPCDTPLLPDDFAPKMLEALSKHWLQYDSMTRPAKVFVARDQSQIHPLHLCIARSYQSSLKQFLAQGERKVMTWLNQQALIWVDFPYQAHYFSNINTPEELKQL